MSDSVSKQRVAKADVSLRPVMTEDREFLLKVYECGREIELSMLPWEPELKRAFIEHQFDAQTTYYASEFPNSRHDIILLSNSGEQAGRLYVDRREAKIAILDLAVLSEYRRRGIGSAVVDGLIEEARGSGKTVEVYVETFNPSKTFFAARGFEIENHDSLNLKFVWHGKKA
jgi:GNAT superfamily N-acetyltransferase